MPEKKPGQRSDGRFCKRVYLGKKDGKALYKHLYGKSQKEVDEKALQAKLAMRKGVDITAERDTFEAWAHRWLKTKKADVSAGRYQVYSYCVDKLEPLKHMPISKIRTSDIQEIILDLAAQNPHTKKPTAKKTLLDLKSAAYQIFQLAVENRVVEYNPVPAVRIPQKAAQAHRRALTEDEQGWIINTPHRAQRAAMIMMYAGLRRGELIPLTWGDIDLDNKTISVNKTVEIIDGKPRIKYTAKSKSGIRCIDIPQRLADYLKASKPDGTKENDLVCPAVDGSIMTASAWRRMWESYLADLNLKYGDIPEEFKSKYNPHGVPLKIPNITPHWLRHTFVTLMYLSGVDILTAKEQAGHADIKTTLEIYTHLDKKYKRNSMDKLDDYLSPGGNP